MKLLLDENLPKDLKQEFPDFEIFTVRDKKWNGLKNGDLIRAMVADGFDVLITLDKHLEFQQNLAGVPIRIILLHARSNRIADLLPLVPNVHLTLRSVKIRVTAVSED
jgi:predicted nuclease of predicted toxin-antitoxin system